MKSAAAVSSRPQQFLLYEADWKQYDQLRRSLDDRGQHAFITFDGHRIELMSPSWEHDRASELIGQLVRAIARITQTEYISGGSTTFKRRDLQRGVEPDKCFWIQNQAKLHGIKRLDLRVHPAPDLAIEVEVSRRLLDRKGIYARLRIPEIWVYNRKSFQILQLGEEQEYRPTEASGVFPMIRFAGVERLLERAASKGELEWETILEKWVRKAIVD
jgi:Uma2 family endonuclease